MIKNINYKQYISYLLIAYAFSFPISKAATNLFEGLAILLWIVEGDWKQKFLLYKNNMLSIAIFSLIGFSLLSIFWHSNPHETFLYVEKYRHFVIIFVFYTSFDKKYISYILSAFLSSMLISELFSYAIFFELIHYKNISPSDPTPFMSHMTYSTILVFTSSVLLIKFFYETNIKYKIFYLLFFITATTNLFINGGRTGQVVFIFLIFITILSSIKNKLKAIILSFSLLIITLFLAYNFSPNFHNRSNQLYTDIQNVVLHDNYRGSGGSRIALNIMGVNTFFDYPLLGTGISHSMKDIKEYAKADGFNAKRFQYFSDYHNGFLTIIVQLGVVGLLISIMIIYALFSFSYKDKQYTLYANLFAVAFVLFSVTHNVFHTMNPMIFFTLFAGYFNALTKKHYISSS